MAQPSIAKPSSIKRKVDLKNPYNEEGKIVKEHPMYFEVLDRAQKLMEASLNELNMKSLTKARDTLEKAYSALDQLAG